MKIFISSTIYDLLDVRAELYEMFKDMGISPVMSEIAESSFEIFTDKNTIETCLINLDKSDSIIIILSQRYGASLKEYGFGDYSTTHLEYQRAVKSKKPIYMYVRDRLEADYTIWDRNRNNKEITCAWVARRDFKLFNLLKDHAKLTAKRPNTNWYKTFKDSVDLKRIIKNDFKISAASTTIQKLLSRNEFPLLVPDLDVDMNAIHSCARLIFRVHIKNSGGTPAFNLSPKWVGDNFSNNIEPANEKTKSILAPGDKTLMTAFYQLGPGHTGCKLELSLSYSNADGYRVTEIYEVKGSLQPDPNMTVISGCSLSKRTFEMGKPFEVEIQGAE